jgi:hypothetical protein
MHVYSLVSQYLYLYWYSIQTWILCNKYYIDPDTLGILIEADTHDANCGLKNGFI